MTRQYILTLMAANRVGILAAITQALTELGGDLQEMSQTVLKDYFTMILHVEFPSNRDPDVVLDHFRGVCRPFGIVIGLKDPTEETERADTAGPTETYYLTVRGQNTPGLLKQVAARLAEDNMDIRNMYGARHDEEPELCAIVIELGVPTDINPAGLCDDLESLGAGLSATLDHESDYPCHSPNTSLRRIPDPLDSTPRPL